MSSIFEGAQIESINKRSALTKDQLILQNIDSFSDGVEKLLFDGKPVAEYVDSVVNLSNPKNISQAIKIFYFPMMESVTR